MWWMVMIVMALGGVSCNNFDEPMKCDKARYNCIRRDGCGMALQYYLTGCSAVLEGYYGPNCPKVCKDSLIVLTSTDEGKQLMTCECNENDTMCLNSKSRVEVCRSQVVRAHHNDTILPCTLAHMICQADASCTAALDFYYMYCKSMFQGKKCTHKCRNALEILRRQEKSMKLQSCMCDGKEEYDCPQIRANMAKLCFHKKVPEVGVGDVETNVIRDGSSSCRWSISGSLLLVAVLSSVIT